MSILRQMDRFMRPGKRSHSKGAASVELALLSPVLVLMLVGTADFARFLYDGIVVTNAARAGAQYGMLYKGSEWNLGGIVQAALNDVGSVQGVTVTPERYCTCSDGALISCDNTCGINGAPRVYIKVRAQKTFQTILPYPGVPSTIQLTREAIIRGQ